MSKEIENFSKIFDSFPKTKKPQREITPEKRIKIKNSISAKKQNDLKSHSTLHQTRSKQRNTNSLLKSSEEYIDQMKFLNKKRIPPLNNNN